LFLFSLLLPPFFPFQLVVVHGLFSYSLGLYDNSTHGLNACLFMRGVPEVMHGKIVSRHAFRAVHCGQASAIALLSLNLKEASNVTESAAKFFSSTKTTIELILFLRAQSIPSSPATCFAGDP